METLFKSWYGYRLNNHDPRERVDSSTYPKVSMAYIDEHAMEAGLNNYIPWLY